MKFHMSQEIISISPTTKLFLEESFCTATHPPPPQKKKKKKKENNN